MAVGGATGGGGGSFISMSDRRHGESHRPDLSLTRCCTRPAEIGQVIIYTGRGIDAFSAKVG